jgi:hypothetical protein
MLTHTVSLKLQLPACLTIHNQSPDIKLVSPVYFCNGAVCPKLTKQQIDISTKIRVCFEINAIRNDFEGALLYKLQRRSGNQRDMNTSTTETKNGTKYVHMLIIWKVKYSEPFAYVALVEHSKEFAWNETELRRLYNKNCGWIEINGDIKSYTWFMDDNIALKTPFEASVSEGNFALSISISEERESSHVMKPFCINPER